MKRLVAYGLAVLFLLVLSMSFSAAAAGVEEKDTTDCTAYAVNGEALTEEKLTGKVTLFVFFSITDHNGFLTLDDMQYSDWILDPKVQVVAVDMSDKSDTELAQYQEYYGFYDMLFCHESELEKVNLIQDWFAETREEVKSGDPVVVITDQSGALKHSFTGYQRPDDLKAYVQELTVAPEIPSDIRIFRLADGSVNLLWGQREGNISFEVYRSDRPDGAYTLFSGTEDGNTGRDFKEEKIGYYKIRCLEEKADGVTYSDFTAPVSASVIADAPEINVQMVSDGEILTLTSSSTEQDGYLVSFSQDGGKTFSQETEVTDGSCKIPQAQAGSLVRVCSYQDTKWGRTYSFSTEYQSIR